MTARKSYSRILVFLLAILAPAVWAAPLTIEPQNPVIKQGEQLTLTVTNASQGTLTWAISKGQIQGQGKQVSYQSPAQPGVDAVMVLDEAGNVGVVTITILPPDQKTLVTPPSTTGIWEVFANKPQVQAIAVSKDGKTFWTGSRDGLEWRDAKTGDLIRLFTQTDGLPENDIRLLLADDKDGLWIRTARGGLAYREANGSWHVYQNPQPHLELWDKDRKKRLPPFLWPIGHF